MVSKGQVLNERYRLLSLEGQGGVADVYKARDQTLDRIVALKILRSEYNVGNAFQHEARAAARVPHPNIVTVYDVGQDGETQYIVMEYAEGETLKDLLQSPAPIRIGHVLDIICQVCDAVGFAHEKGIIHCDIKPQNVLVRPDGEIKVTDFGIARAFSPGTPEQFGRLWGTPYYASPELISGKSLTPASDVYAIGVMLYEMLCGKRPFGGQTAAEIARQHVVNAPPPLQQHNPRITHHLCKVIDRALAKDPTQRYPTAKDMGAALRTYRQHGSSVTQPMQPIRAADIQAAKQGPAPTQGTTPRTRAQAQSSQRIDWVMLLLGGLAFLAIMGLIPIWGTVLTRALVPAPLPTATLGPQNFATQDLSKINTPALLTPNTELWVTVPDLVGRELSQARQLAGQAGLTLAVNEQRHDAQAPASHVILQTPAAGEKVLSDSNVGVAVSLGPEMVIMPETIGFPAAVKQLDLQDLGLTVSITETWSVEPIGLVISQMPTAGAAITVGSTVTLTASSGLKGEVRANFDDKLYLWTCELNSITFRPGDAVQVMITWRVQNRLPESYMLFIHLVDRDGRIFVQRDELPLGGSRPTNTWQPGEQLFDPHTVTLPGNTPLGDYWVHVGLYKGNNRLPVVDPGVAETKENAVIVRQISVGSN